MYIHTRTDTSIHSNTYTHTQTTMPLYMNIYLYITTTKKETLTQSLCKNKNINKSKNIIKPNKKFIYRIHQKPLVTLLVLSVVPNFEYSLLNYYFVLLFLLLLPITKYTRICIRTLSIMQSKNPRKTIYLYTYI